MDEIILVPYSKSEFMELIYVAVKSALDKRGESKQTPPQPFIKGIHELAKFLKISPARAQKLKNEGVFPYWQDGRTLLFDPEKVRQVMTKKEVKHGK